MLYWGELSSADSDSSAQRTKTLDEIFPSSRPLLVSLKEDQTAFIRHADRKAFVVKSCGRSPEQKQYKRKILELKKERVALLSSGRAHVVLVSEAGAVFEWKRSDTSNNPRIFPCLTNHKIAQVACGNYHSIVLTKDGQLFTWGQNSNGQLGLGKGESSPLSPQPLKSLCGMPLTLISAGGNHSFALSLSGAVFSWGKNSNGQLGLGDTEERHAPVCVESLNLKKTVFISCGEDHTAVLTKEGMMFTFGSGCYGQLGHNSLRDELRPRIVAEFWGSKVSQIACGRHHTLALVQSTKTIYSFGCGEQGQLGNKERSNYCVPVPVHLPSECAADQTVKEITAGGNLSVAFYSDQNDQMQSAGTNLSSCRDPVFLSDKVIDQWISARGSKAWKKVQRQIRKMFSSLSCINGSFIEKSIDKHYKTSRGNSGLDLSLARLAFEKLTKRDQILSEVLKTVEKILLPSLGSAAPEVEALRVYLILPELLQVLNKQRRGLKLSVSLAAAISNLDQESMDILTSLWTRLPYDYYKDLVNTFHAVSEHYVSLITSCNCWTEVTALLKVLQKLYTVNRQRVTQLTEDCFHSRKIIGLFDFMEWMTLLDARLWVEPSEILGFLKSVKDLISYSFVLDTKCKQRIFLLLQKRHYQHTVFFFENSVCVKRPTVLEDTVTYLKKKRHNFSLPLMVKFSLEDGIDDGGVSAEFFTILGQAIRKASNLTQASEDSGLFWFCADESYYSEQMYYFGVICGLAFYNHCYINIGFPLALFKKLLNYSPTFRDLEELSPVEARSLNTLLTEDEDVLELLDLDFTVKGQELVPNGANIAVTKGNRQKYVDMYVDFVFNKSVKKEFGEFAKGFSRGNPFNFWKIYQPEELRELLYGTAEYKWEELQEVAKYAYCGPSDELIQNFWSVFLGLGEDQQKKFLTFMYGTDRLPIGGLSKLHLAIVRHDFDDSDNRFPTVQTCFGILLLPNYSTIDVLREKLVHAITFCEVFGQK